MRFFNDAYPLGPEPLPGHPAISVANVQMALLIGARTPAALGRLFGIDEAPANEGLAVSDALDRLMNRGDARWMDRPDDKLVVLLRDEKERPYDDVRRKPSPRPEA
jgi:hypothetical protein